MSNMDEISYWVYTKRAPCLLNYDKFIKTQSVQAQCSTSKPVSIESETAPSPKKKKLKLLDDSASTEKQQNIYFKTPPDQKLPLGCCESGRVGSDVDLNINNSSRPNKVKNSKLQRSRPPRVLKKDKIASSTPKVVVLRRSLRTAQKKCNNHNTSHLDSSFQVLNSSMINGNGNPADERVQQTGQGAADHPSGSKVKPVRGTNELVINGQFEDLSDVSGLTANYIRSTKVHSSRRPQKLRNQTSRTLAKHSKERVPRDKIIVCVNKSVNTGFPGVPVINCSSDSSQNALKLVTVKDNAHSTSVNKATSLLKFVETKLENNTNSKSNKRVHKNNLNISFQSRSSGASRYPRRHKNNTDTPEQNCSTNIASKANRSSSKYDVHKGTPNKNLKENSEHKPVSRTRSGKRKGLTLDVEERSPIVIELNSSTEPVTTSPTVNVAHLDTKHTRNNNVSTRCLRSRTTRGKGQFYKESSSEESGKFSHGMPGALEHSTPKCVRRIKKTVDRAGRSLTRDSSRDKSGFAACFSDSDSDSVPLKQRKFFC